MRNLQQGTNPAAAWSTLADSFNVAEVLCEMNIANDHAKTIDAAQEVLAELHRRHAEKNTWTMRAAEMQALEQAVVIHGIQLRFASQGEVANAIATVKRRLAAALAGNASPKTRMCIGNIRD